MFSKAIPIFVCYLFPLITYAQQETVEINDSKSGKPSLDTSIFNHWTSVEDIAGISNNGQFIYFYRKENEADPSTLTLKDIEINKVLEVARVTEFQFTNNNRWAICRKSGDSLGIINLKTFQIDYIIGVGPHKLFNLKGSEWLTYLESKAARLILVNMDSGEKRLFEEISKFYIGEDGSCLLLRSNKMDSLQPYRLDWIDSLNGRSRKIWQGNRVDNVCFDASGKQVAFTAISDHRQQLEVKRLWYYKNDMPNAVHVDYELQLNTDIPGKYALSDLTFFSKDGSKLFFRLTVVTPFRKAGNVSEVDVWSYTDGKIQSKQLAEINIGTNLCVFLIKDFKVIKLQGQNEICGVYSYQRSDDFLLSESYEGEPYEWSWSKAAQTRVYVISTNTGARHFLNKDLMNRGISRFTISPQGKYVVYFDPIKRSWFSCETSTSLAINISKAVKTDWSVIGMHDQPYYLFTYYQLAGFDKDDSFVFIYDQTDIWKMDLSGIREPQNLTNGFGRRNRLVFRFAIDATEKQILNEKDGIVSTFDKSNKNNGFYKLRAGNDPLLLTMGPYIYFLPDEFIGFAPIKAKDKEVYLVQRQSARDAPNYYWTSDFKKFVVISDVNPQKKYNWLTSELVGFSTTDGKSSQGILYKPENFDSKKKYPVIFHYYDKKSQELNKFQKPGMKFDGDMDIAWFVSRGYLVFIPDVQYTIGKLGESVLNSVTGAAGFLSELPFVEKNKMGLQGHSFGGYETNYIVTHSNRFAAACSSSGMSDLTSNYLGLLGKTTNHDWYENRFCRMGVTLWENKQLYIKNSPVFELNKVTTPILTVANKRDPNVSFAQGLELFLGLRRLGKKAWMLQYDNGGHGLNYLVDWKDYITRMNQFFDHYLKEAAAPKWMLDGIPARMKGIDDGLELDKSGRTPGPGLLIVPSGK